MLIASMFEGQINRPCSILDAMLFAPGLVILVSAIRSNKAYSKVVTVIPNHPVVIHGFYSVVRHPQYLGAIMIISVYSNLIDSLCTAFFGGVAVGILIGRIKFEEEFLLDHVPAYHDYVETVRFKLVPWVY